MLIGCLATGLLFNPPAVFAESKAILPAPPVQTEGDISKAKVPLNKAIETAKSTFEIPNTLDRFESGFSSYGDKAEWNLNWSRSQEPGGSLSVRVNALSGEIVGMDRWEAPPPGQKYTGIPKYSYNDGAKLAQEWAKKLAPRYSGQTKLELAGEQPNYGYGDRGPAEYSYNFPRLVNGITYPENNFYLRISGDTGELLGFSVNWDEKQAFPEAQNKISADQAKKVFDEQVELVYFRPYTYGAKDTPVKLVYRNKNGQDPSIDALTGKVLDNNGYRGFDDSKMGSGGVPEKAIKQDLSPAEQAEVDKIKGLISREKALEYAKKAVPIPTDLVQDESRLTQDYQFPDLKLWNFNWRSEKSGTGISIQASVDAVTGELVSFNRWDSLQNEKTPENQPKYTLEQARQAAGDFIKKQQPQRFGEVRFSNSRVDDFRPLTDKVVPLNYNLSFVRVANNIPFPNNGFDLRIDPYTGEVTSYQMNWWKVNFPGAAGIIDSSQAANVLLSDGGLVLDYQRIYREGQDSQMYLVYHVKDRRTIMVDARMGTGLGWDGEPLPTKQSGEFSDIAGHPAEGDIKILARANIAKSEDGKFYPDRNITKQEALEFLVPSRGWPVEPLYSSLQDKKDKDEATKRLINSAINLGIIEPGDTGGLEQELTRLELAKLLINTLDYDGAAKLKDIYYLKSKDAYLIPGDLRGYVALSLGLGIQTENNGLYRPGEKISRGYAATSLVRMLKVQK